MKSDGRLCAAAHRHPGRRELFSRWHRGTEDLGRALTDTEVGDLYQSDQVPTDGLVAQYLLDEGSGTVAFDTSGGDNNGTIHGATWSTM